MYTLPDHINECTVSTMQLKRIVGDSFGENTVTMGHYSLQFIYPFTNPYLYQFRLHCHSSDSMDCGKKKSIELPKKLCCSFLLFGASELKFLRRFSGTSLGTIYPSVRFIRCP